MAGDCEAERADPGTSQKSLPPGITFSDCKGEVRKVEAGFDPQMLLEMELTIETLLDHEPTDDERED